MDRNKIYACPIGRGGIQVQLDNKRIVLSVTSDEPLHCPRDHVFITLTKEAAIGLAELLIKFCET